MKHTAGQVIDILRALKQEDRDFVLHQFKVLTLVKSDPLNETATKPVRLRERMDRSGHRSHQLAKGHAMVKEAIFEIQREDQANGLPERTIDNMHAELVKRGKSYPGFFVFGTVKDQVAQLRRVKSIHPKHFGGLKGEYADRFMILRPLRGTHQEAKEPQPT